MREADAARGRRTRTQHADAARGRRTQTPHADAARGRRTRMHLDRPFPRLTWHRPSPLIWQDHPFFDGLKIDPAIKVKEWDAETILSTYTTTDNHPTQVARATKPRRGATPITLDPRTGLPRGIMLPAEEERMRKAAAERAAMGEHLAATGRAAEAEAEDDDDEYEVVNAGAPRQRGEAADEKRERKAAAKAAQAARRAEKKQSKEAFRLERVAQVQIKNVTTQLPSTSLSRW